MSAIPKERAVDCPNRHTEILNISLGHFKFEQELKICCPNERNPSSPHQVNRNGKDYNLDPPVQKYYCKTCKKSFYAHTSGLFYDFVEELKDIFYHCFRNGKLNSEELQKFSLLSPSQCRRILEKILIEIETNSKIRKIHEKHRNSNTLIVDETFLTINHKTYYLIVIISGNNKIMGFKIVKKREKSIILQLVQDCCQRLNYGFKIFVTDGFSVYKGVAQALKQDLIHIRHIHAPPYGRIIIDTISHSEYHIHITRVKTTTDFLLHQGYFLTQMKTLKKRNDTPKKRGRPIGSKNRPKKIIEQEKREKAKRKGKIGRPKGSKSSKNDWKTHVYWMDKKAGEITPLGGASPEFAMSAKTIYKQFREKHITTNLIEKEFSALKKLLGERGNRSIKRWERILLGYFTIRDNPRILKKILNQIKIPPQWGKYGLLQQIELHLNDHALIQR